MQVGFTDDQLQFQEVVARFLGDKSPPTAVRRQMETEKGYDPDVWGQLCGEVGLTGTHFPEGYGGFDFGPVELGIICQQMGRHLYCGPYFSSAVMAGYALLLMGDEPSKQALLPEIARGTTIATLVLDALDAPDHVGTHLVASGDVINGEASIVVDAHVADTLIVLARAGNDLNLYQVAPKDVQITPLTSVDATRKICSVVFSDVSATRIGEHASVKIPALWDHMSVALAHEMIGGAERLFETTIEYMKMRVQFGRAIGSFQALKHRCADLLLDIELAKAVTHASAQYLATGEGDHYSPNMAKAMASEAYLSMAKQAIQLRGGIGFTWEEDTHLWFKRAKASEVFLGTANTHRDMMMNKIQESEHV
ncbi:MAG: acyl-CoA dehydrogenase family protein [Pseudomonadota bacterium]